MTLNVEPPAEQMARDHSHYAPAYQLGHLLAKRYPQPQSSWHEVESEARQKWTSTYLRPWEEYTAVVRHAWHESRGELQSLAGGSASDFFGIAGVEIVPFEEQFRRHFSALPLSADVSYRRAAPAYHLGFDVGVNGRFRRLQWDEVKTSAEKLWAYEPRDFFWQDIEDAAAFGWQMVRDQPNGQIDHVSQFLGFTTLFQGHYYARESDQSLSYRQLAPAYYLGFDLALDPTSAEKSWSADLLEQARTRWLEQETQTTWPAAERAARFAWQVAFERR